MNTQFRYQKPEMQSHFVEHSLYSTYLAEIRRLGAVYAPSHNFTVSSTILSRELWNKLFVLLRTGGFASFSSLIPWGRHLCAKASGSSSHTRDTSFIKEHHILVQKHHLGGSEWTAPARQKLFKFSLPWCAKLKTVVFGSPEWSAVGKCNSACLSSTSRSPYKHIAKQCFEGRKKVKATHREEKHWSQIKYKDNAISYVGILLHLSS